jgi:hypothetical protein
MIKVLKDMVEVFDGNWFVLNVSRKWSEKAMNTLDNAKKEIAKLEEKEQPVAWLHDVIVHNGEHDRALSFTTDMGLGERVGVFKSLSSEPLYKLPQPRNPLTEKQLKNIWYNTKKGIGWHSFEEVAKAVEKAHEIKE